MTNLLMKQFNHHIVTLDQELKRLESHPGPVTGYAAIKQWSLARAKVAHLLLKLHTFALNMEMYESVAQILYELQQRLEQLPHVPDITHLERARNLLLLRPCIVVTKDRQPDSQGAAELQQIVVMTSDKQIIFEQAFLPQQGPRRHSQTNMLLSEQTCQKDASFPSQEIWADLTKAVSGRYILAYDYSLVQIQLAVTAELWQLPIPVLIGESFLNLYFAYIGVGGQEQAYQVPLTHAVLEQIATPFSRTTSPTALEQATRILELTEAIADGTLNVPALSEE